MYFFIQVIKVWHHPLRKNITYKKNEMLIYTYFMALPLTDYERNVRGFEPLTGMNQRSSLDPWLRPWPSF